MDPLAESYHSYSPYNYALNDPIGKLDPNGMWVALSKNRGWSTTDPADIAAFLQSNEINVDEQDDPKKKAGVIANSSGSIIRKNSGGQLIRSQLQKGSPETDAILDNANELWMGATPIGIVFDIKAGISGEDMSGEKLSPFWRIAGLFPFISEFRKTAKGVSVIGPRSTYREFAKKIGANFLDVTDEAWTMRKNVEFLQGVVKKGDDVIFSGKYNPDLLNPKSVLAQEIRYLQRHGYTWTDDFSRMIKK